MGRRTRAAAVLRAHRRPTAQIDRNWRTRSTGTSEEIARTFCRSAGVLSEAIADRVNLGRHGATAPLAAVRPIASESSNTLEGSCVWDVDNLVRFRHEKSNRHLSGYAWCFGVFRGFGAGAEWDRLTGHHSAHHAHGGAARAG